MNRVYVHLVWGTWDRLPLLTPARRREAYAAMKSKCDELGCEVFAIGGIEDHVHLVVQLSATVGFATLAKEVKGCSSHLLTHGSDDGFFKWQGAYAAFSVEQENLPALVEYVRNQEAHHRDQSHKPEHEISFEEPDAP